MSHAYDVVLLTEDRYESPAETDWYVAQILREETLLREALERRGLRVGRVSWSNPAFDWSRTKIAVFRSTWDYFVRVESFLQWLVRCETRTHLINAAPLVRWNLDKHYLLDLERAGVPIPPTRIFERSSGATLAEAFRGSGWSEAVLKPAISGAGRHTYRIGPNDVERLEGTFRELLEQEAMLLQEFRPEILQGGELSLIFIAGRFAHAARKIAKSGEFRVQDDHGGKAYPHEAAPDEIAFAAAAIEACPSAPTYARVDLLRTADARLLLMELELIEPELFFRLHPRSADMLAEALANEVRVGRS